MKRVLAMLVAPLALFSLACGDERKSEPLSGPIQLSPEEQRGQKVFMRNCNECHPGGEGGLGPPLNSIALPEPAIKTKVREKTGNMPSFSETALPPDDLDKLVDYLETLRDR
jgi:mono/diheme cytochrome c family protein